MKLLFFTLVIFGTSSLLYADEKISSSTETLLTSSDLMNIEATALMYLQQPRSLAQQIHEWLLKSYRHKKLGMRLLEILESSSHQALSPQEKSRHILIFQLAAELLKDSSFSNSEKNQVHAFAQTLLIHHPNRGPHNDFVIDFYNRHSLWNTSDLPYLEKKLLRPKELPFYLQGLIQALRGLDETSRQNYLQETEKRPHLFLPYLVLQLELGTFTADRWTYFLKLLEANLVPGPKRQELLKEHALVRYDQVLLQTLRRIQMILDHKDPELLKALQSRKKKASFEQKKFYELFEQRVFAYQTSWNLFESRLGQADPLHLINNPASTAICRQIFLAF